MTYQAFATLLSAAILIEYAVLVAIAFRRARFRDHRLTHYATQAATHARRIEGPLLTGSFVIGFGLFVSALAIGLPQYPEIARVTLSLIRGFLIVQGFVVFAWYWQVRETWL